MTGQTVTDAVATRDNSPGALVQRYQADFAQVLPSHVKPETFVRLSLGLLRRNTDLAAAAEKNPGSFLAALLECARLGHEPGTDQYALTHFRNNKTGIPEIVGIEQYQGEIERIYRAGAVASIKCEVVRDHDDFTWSPTRMRVPHHEYDALADEKDRGDLLGVYAYAEMSGGAISQVVVMGKSEVMKHRAVAKTKTFWDGEWKASMWKKTSIHELEKWLPTSAEYRREQMRAAAEADSLRQRAVEQVDLPDVPPANVDTTTGEIVDAEIVDTEPDDGGK
jgi:recombination protein RecT